MAKRDAAKTRHAPRQTVSEETGKSPPRSARGSIRTNVQYEAERKCLIIEVFDGHLDKPQIVNCSDWLSSPKVALPFADAAARILPHKKRYRTRDQFEKDLSHGFFKYCQSLERAEELTLNALSTDFFRAFINKFLGAKRDDGSFRFAVSTRIHRVGSLREVIEELKRSNRTDLPKECNVPRQNWAGESRDFKATEPLPFPLLKKFYACCRDHVAATMKKMEAFWESKAIVEKALRSKRRIEDSYQNRFARAVVDILEECGGFLSERQVLAERPSGKAFALTQLYGYKNLASVMYPQSKDLVPFVYLLAFFTLFNPQPLLDLSDKGIRFERVLGVMRVRVASTKYRALGTMQRRSFVIDDSDDNPGRLIQFILRWTEPLRKFCDAKTQGKLFIYSPRNKGDRPKVETYALRPSGRAVSFNNHANLFCGENGFDWVGLRRVRATGAEIADLAFEGDPIAIRTLLGHKRAGADEHYRANSAKRRGEARLATGMHLRQRHVDSQGRIDPRGPHRDESLSGATPGWDCLDPYNSPIATETRGRLCTALGKCPACPLALLRLSSPYSFCRCLQLKERFTAARAELGPIAWEQKWGKEYSKLTTFWLPQFRDKRVLTAGRQLTLSPFPPLD